MSGHHDVTIYLRNVQLEVTIPEDSVWQFMKIFGETFAIEDVDGTTTIKAVDGYCNHPSGWHVQISVFEGDENKFYDFLEKFCVERKLSFRDPREHPVN